LIFRRRDVIAATVSCTGSFRQGMLRRKNPCAHEVSVCSGGSRGRRFVRERNARRPGTFGDEGGQRRRHARLTSAR
jgi:hypothetical protein